MVHRIRAQLGIEDGNRYVPAATSQRRCVFRVWHVCDMPRGPWHVCLAGKTGSRRLTAKPTRLTHVRHARSELLQRELSAAPYFCLLYTSPSPRDRQNLV